MNFYQYFIVTWSWLINFSKFENLGRAIFFKYHCFHTCSSHRSGFILMAYCYDHISLFVPFFDIAVGLGICSNG